MRFRLIDAAKKEFPVQRVSARFLASATARYFARKDRPACRRQESRTWCCWAHIRSAFALSNATYGSPRMTRELRDDVITIGRHRVARLMRENAPEGAAESGASNERPTACTPFRSRQTSLNQDFNAAGAEPEMGCRHLLRLDTRGLGSSSSPSLR